MSRSSDNVSKEVQSCHKYTLAHQFKLQFILLFHHFRKELFAFLITRHALLHSKQRRRFEIKRCRRLLLLDCFDSVRFFTTSPLDVTELAETFIHVLLGDNVMLHKSE